MSIEYVLPEFQSYESLPVLPDLDTVIWKWTREQVQEWWEVASAVAKHNQGVYRHNHQTRTVWRQIFETNGGKPWGVRGTASLKWFDTAMDALGDPQHSSPNMHDAYGYRTFTLRDEQVRPHAAVSKSPSTLMEVWDGARRLQGHWEIQQSSKTNEEAVLMGMATKLGVDPAGFESVASFLIAVQEAAQDAWVQENYPNGTEVDIDCCYHCDTWEVGDNRCSCGNRRVYLDIQGNVVTGFYAYPQGH